MANVRLSLRTRGDGSDLPLPLLGSQCGPHLPPILTQFNSLTGLWPSPPPPPLFVGV